jgi:hypothetical protein
MIMKGMIAPMENARRVSGKKSRNKAGAAVIIAMKIGAMHGSRK